MENLIEPEGQTTSDNFSLSDKNNGEAALSSQSAWGELNADEQSYLGKKGFDTPADLLKSYRALEKAYSSKISLPKDGDEEAWHKLYSRLGMPENSEAFNLCVKDEDLSFCDDFKRVCWQNNILPQSAQAVYDWFVNSRNNQVENMEQERVEQSFKEMEEQKALWGAKANRNMEQMKRGIRLFAKDDETAVDAVEQALGTKRMMQIFCRLGEAVSEDNPVAFGGNTRSSDNDDMAAFFKEMFHGL